MENLLTAMLENHQLRVTKPRLEVFRILKSQHKPLSIAEIIKLCPTIDKVSVYRTIALFQKHSVVTVVSIGWKQSYELSNIFAAHHHHMICNLCNNVIEIKSNDIEDIIRVLSRRNQFVTQSHHFEIRGICQNCISSQS